MHNVSEQTGAKLVRFRSRDHSVVGFDGWTPRDDVQGVIDCMDASHRSHECGEGLNVLVVGFPIRATIDDLERVAMHARRLGLEQKLCLVIPNGHRALLETIEQLQRLDLRALLGGIGAQSRFADMTDHAIDGIALDPQLICRAAGDPQATSILEAIASLATNLGLKSFARHCLQCEVDVATDCGVDYIAPALPAHVARGARIRTKQALPSHA